MGKNFGNESFALKRPVLRFFLFDGVTVAFLAVFLSIGTIESN